MAVLSCFIVFISATLVHSQVHADLVLASSQYAYVLSTGRIPQRRLSQARGVPEVESVVPMYLAVAPFKNMTWVNDAHYMVIPKGVAPEKVGAIVDLMAYLLTPQAQAYTYDKGYFYPGPAVKDVTLSMAPKESQDAIKEYGRPEYDAWLAQFPHTQSLEPKSQVEAFRIWDQQVGAQKTK